MSEENKNFENELQNEAEEIKTPEKNEGVTYEEAQKYSAVLMDADSTEEQPPKQTKKKKISLSTFVTSAIAIVLVTVMMTWSFCTSFYRQALAEIAQNGIVMDAPSDKLGLINAILETYSYYDLDEEEMLEAVVEAYKVTTGDRYATYMNKAEYDNYNASMAGNTVGIGITVIESTLKINGADIKVYKIINVAKNSPAQEAGVLAGDLIAYIGASKDAESSVDALGYETSFAMMIGAAGTKAEFTVLRRKAGSQTEYEEKTFSIERKKIVASSVYSHVCETDATVGIVKITGFEYNTPEQFCDAVDALRAKGIKKIVFDLRYNGGGALVSIVAVLSYFLDEGDTIMSTQANGREPEFIKAGVVSGLKGSMAACNVSRGDIGKYKDLEVAVLCNGNTASAAELFTATFRDYELGKIVGTTTFGKGAMQTTIDLSYFGYEGAVKLTTDMYFPPCGESYDGTGITPDVVVELDEALYGKNIYEITDAEDNQLGAAIKTFEK